MTILFRNVDVDTTADLADWPPEAIEILVDRGSLSDWHRLADALANDPWGSLARTVEEIVGLDCHYGADRIMARILERERGRSALAGPSR